MDGPWYQPELDRLATLLNTMQRGALAVALCEDPRLREEAMRRLRGLVRRPLHELSISAECADPIDLLRGENVKPGEVVCFYGLEDGAEDALKRLEWGREAVWEREANLLIWITGEGQRRLLRLAPNFYSRRTLLARLTPPALAPVTALVVETSFGASTSVGEVRANGKAPAGAEWLREWLQVELPRARFDVPVERTRVDAVALFEDAEDAVRCAVALKQHQARELRFWSVPVGISIGLHTATAPPGEAAYQSGAVEVADALSGLGSSGQILLSGETVAAVGERLPELSTYEHVVLLATITGLQSDVYELLEPGQYPRPLRMVEIPTNLPPRPEGMLGRRALLERLAERLDRCESVQLVGGPGVGKSTLALEAAHSAYAARRFIGGVVWINLEDDPSLDSLLVTAAAALSLTTAGPQRPDELRQRLDEHFEEGPCLLVMDGAHAVTHHAVKEWLAGLPETAVRLLTTRRMLPWLRSVEALRVGSLPPGQSATLLREHGRRHPSNSGEELDAQVRRIARLCGGVPLALELAAAWTGEIPAAEIASGLEETPAEGRTRSLHRAVSWACARLSAAERELLAGCSLFEDPFTREAAQALAGEAGVDAPLDGLKRRLLVREQAGRSALHPFVREHARKLFSTLPNANELAARFAGYYAELAANNYDINNLEKLALLDAEWRNALAAADHAFQNGFWSPVIELSGYSNEFMRLRGLLREQERLAKLGLQAAVSVGDALAHGGALNNLGLVYESQGRWAEAEQAYQQSLAICREHGDRVGEGRALNNLGNVYQRQGRWAEAEQAYQQSLAICREHGHQVGEGLILNNLGLVYESQGRWAEAEQAYQQDLAICREYGDRVGEGQTLNNLGLVYSNQGRWAEAEQAYQQSLAIKREYGGRVGEGQTLRNLALLLHASGRRREALATVREALWVLEQTQDVREQERARTLVQLLEAEVEQPEASAAEVEETAGGPAAG